MTDLPPKATRSGVVGRVPFAAALRIGAQDRGIMIALTLLMLLLGATGSGGAMSIDEVLYLAGSFALAETGSFSIDNGYGLYGSPSLVPLLMVAGDGGRLLPQYPAGTFFVAWPFVQLFGLQGLAVMNGVAAAASLWLTRSIALALFGDRTLAMGAVLLLAVASFLPDYASALWPHALALALALAMVRTALASAGSDGSRALIFGLLTGLIGGLSVTVRVDAVLLVPPLALWLVYAARAPIRTLCGAGLGYAGGLTVASLLNALKFGSFTPVTYGRSEAGGLTSLAAYQDLLVPLVAGAAAAIGIAALCRRGGRAPRVLAWLGVTAILGAAVAIAFIPAIRPDVGNLRLGLHTVVVDMRASIDTRLGIEMRPDGTKSFWGLAKQALGQSMPWIGLLLGLSVARSGAARWHGLSLCLLLIATVVFFFGRVGWHGGLSANMRYYLPIVPFLAIVGAWAIRDLIARAGQAAPASVLRPWTIGAAAVLFAAMLAILVFEQSVAWIRQPFATGLLALAALVALASQLPGAAGRTVARGAQPVIGAVLAFAFLSAAIGDRFLTQQRRDFMAARMAAIPVPEGPYLVVSGSADAAASVLWDAEGWLSLPPLEAGFLETVLRDGRRVIVADIASAQAIAASDTALQVVGADQATNFAEIGLTRD